MKDIRGYEGLYAVTEDGQVWSYRRQKFLKLSTGINGHGRVRLCKDGKPVACYVSKLVAEAYIPNPDNLPQITHKDGDVTNNKVDNLEWQNRQLRAVYCVELDKVFPSIADAAKEMYVSYSTLYYCLSGKTKTSAGYHWEYVKERGEKNAR